MISQLILQYLYEKEDLADSIFDNKKPNDSAKFIPKFLKKKKKKNKLSDELKKILNISRKKIRGMNISTDANDDELEAEKYMRKHGMMK